MGWAEKLAAKQWRFRHRFTCSCGQVWLHYSAMTSDEIFLNWGKAKRERCPNCGTFVDGVKT